MKQAYQTIFKYFSITFYPHFWGFYRTTSVVFPLSGFISKIDFLIFSDLDISDYFQLSVYPMPIKVTVSTLELDIFASNFISIIMKCWFGGIGASLAVDVGVTQIYILHSHFSGTQICVKAFRSHFRNWHGISRVRSNWAGFLSSCGWH